MIPELDLKSESTELDRYIKIRKISYVLGQLPPFLFLIGIPLAAFVITNHGGTVLIITFATAVISAIISDILNRKTISERKLFSYILYKIYVGLKNESLNKKYVKLLFEKTTFREQEKIIESDPLFKEYISRKELFKKNLNEFSLKVNYLINNKYNPKVDIEPVADLYRTVYYGEREILDISNKLTKISEDKEKFPVAMDRIKYLLSFNLIKGIVSELILIGVLLIIYKYITKDMTIIMTGFFIISSTILILFGKNKKSE